MTEVDTVFLCGMPLATITSQYFAYTSLTNLFHIARLQALGTTTTNIRGYEVSAPTASAKVWCSSVLALSSNVFYVNVMSGITSQLILYIATFDDANPGTLALQQKIYFSSVGA